MSHGSPDGAERYTTQSVTFTQQFTLGDPPEDFPAGTYEVEAREQAFEASGRTAYLRKSTVLIIPTATGIRCREIQASQLDFALSRDARHEGGRQPSENPDRGRADFTEEARAS